MRVISGKLGGRTLTSPNGHRTHPMSEKIRGALFSSLGDINGLKVLDAFGGSGAIGIEACSRGASSTIIDTDNKAYQTIVVNVEKLDLTNCATVIKANAGGWSDRHKDMTFDVVILDPPYNDVHPGVLDKLIRHIKVKGILVASLPPTYRYPIDAEQFLELSRKNYGDSELAFYRRIS